MRSGREAKAARAGSSLELVARSAEGFWDRRRLETACENLLDNAIKYGGGKPIEVRVEADERSARLLVIDHGIGIAGEEQQRIFERFQRSAPSLHFSGFGLGLWIVRQIASVHGGSVRVSSEPGAGSSFTLELPRQGAGR